MKAVIHKMLKHLESAPVESHSFSKLAYTALYNNRIDVRFVVGSVTPSTVDGKPITNYAWLECLGYIVDFRATKQISGDAPHGLFTHEEAQSLGFIYNGKEQVISPLDDHVVTFLTATSPDLI